MANEQSQRDQNSITSLLGVTDDANEEVRNLLVDPTTGRLKVSAVVSTDLEGLNNVSVSPAAGDILYYNGTDWVDLPIGTADQVLTVNSSADAPEWTDVAVSVDELSDLNDANVSSPTAGQVLIYDATDTQFENASLTGGTNISITQGDASITINGDVTELSNLNDASISTPSAGQLLIYNTTNSQYENAAITAGSGISKTEGDASLTLSADEANIDHDALLNFVASEHIDHSGVTISAGDGLSGGGDITTSRTLNVDINGTTDLASPAVGDEILLGDISNTNAIRKSDIDTVLALYDSKTATLTNKTIDADGTGNSISNIGANETKLGDGLEDDGSDNIKVEETLAYETGHTAWADALSSEEVHRIVLQTGEVLVVDRIEFQQKGGGSSTSASIDVYDNTAASVIGSANLGSVTKNPGSSGSGNTVLVRVNNSTGGSINATIRVVGRIQNA